MKMFKRWYDADAAVSKVINDLEKSPESIQVQCAEYIIDLMKDIENHNLDEGNVQGYVGKSIIRAVDELLNDNMDSDGFIEMMPA